MKVTITPTRLEGQIRIPSSKSMTHREIIASALAHGESRLTGVSWSQDIEATVRILSLLGASIQRQEGTEGTTLLIKGGLKAQGKPVTAHAGESGSTLRFLIPLGLVSGNEMTYTGEGWLAERPLSPYYQIFDEKGITWKGKNGLPLYVKGQLLPGTYALSGNVSSQLFTGLLFALPLLEGNSRLVSTTPLESESYVKMTLDTLARHGITVNEAGRGQYEIPGNQTYKAGNFAVEGDFSQAAFWLAAGLLGGPITLKGLSMDSLQGDKAIVSLLRRMGGCIEETGEGLYAGKSRLHGIVMDAENVPDLVPVMAALTAVSEGTTEIVHAERVRLKECDRLHAMAVELSRLGARVEEKEDGLVIHGGVPLHGGVVSSWNDHRIAMALASISPAIEGRLTIDGADSVRKSYPRFWDDFVKTGGQCNYE